VPGLILASVPVNSEAGSYLTFGGPVGLFVVVAAILYLLFSRPHRRVPPRRTLAASRGTAPAAVTPAAPGTGGAGNVSGTTASSEAPPAGATATDETPGPDKNTEASE
jgi:hypothetical protein